MVHLAVRCQRAFRFVHVHQDEFGDVLVGPVIPSVFIPLHAAVRGQWNGQQLLRGPVLEGFVLVSGFRPRPRPHVFVLLSDGRQTKRIRLLWVRWVADVKQRELRAGPIESSAVFVGRAEPNGQQMVLREWVDVGGDAGHLEFAQNRRVGFVADVDDPQGVNLLEGHDIGAVTIKASAPNPFAGSDAVHLPRLDEDLLIGLHVNRTDKGDQLRGHRFRIVHPPAIPLAGGRRHAQDAFVLRKGKLVDDRAVDAARAGVQRCIGRADVKRVKVGHLIHAVVVPKPPPVEGGFREHQHVG